MKRFRRDYLFAVAMCAFILFSFTSSAAAGTIFVKWDSPGPVFDGASWDTAYHSVQQGLDAAVSGDEVRVAAGTYVECITLKDGVALLGGFAGVGDARDIETYETVLDGDQQGSVVTSPPGATTTTQIDGFAIRNGHGTWDRQLQADCGAGIYCSNSSPLISNNTITDNRSPYWTWGVCGAGVYCSNSSAIIRDNVIVGNGRFPVGPASSYGGGIYCLNSSPMIRNNTIAGNRVYRGAGVYCSAGSPVIVDNRIVANIAVATSSRSAGGGICLTGVPATAVIANNSIVGNSAAGFYYDAGGGIYLDESSPLILNNTVTGNYSQEGGAIYCEGSSSPAISNNVLGFNSSGVFSGEDAAPILHSNCVYNPGGYDYLGTSAGPGDIQADPKLVAPEFGEVHLASGSPCIDAGWTEAPGMPETDMDGDSRVLAGTVDIGADEYTGVPPSFVPTVIRVTPSGNDGNGGSSWSSAKRTLGAAIDAAPPQGCEIWVAGDSDHPYNEDIALKEFVYLYGGFAGTESTRAERNWQANVTIIDGVPGDSIVTAMYIPGYRLCAVDGFVLRNGTTGHIDGFAFPAGGAICCACSSPTIRNNVLTGNRAGVGGAISCHFSSSPLIADNEITGNGAQYVAGGAIYCGSSAWPTIANNWISDNRGGSGGAISLLWNWGRTTIVNNVITGNTADYEGTIYVWHGPKTILNNTIVGNTASSGAGIYLADGVRLDQVDIANNVIAFNSSGIYRRPSADTPTLRHNDVFGNAEYDYYGFPTDPTGTYGNISLDPLFRDMPGGDYHLRWDSPCIDAGTDEGAPPTDIEGTPRPVDGDWDGLAVTDIGAYEYAPIQVTIDVLPGNSGNVINPQPNRMITVAVLSDLGFDARNIEPSSVRFGPGQAAEAHNRGHWEDVNGDGLIDLLLHFRCGETGIQPADTSATLRGRLNDGERIMGSDAITVRER